MMYSKTSSISVTSAIALMIYFILTCSVYGFSISSSKDNMNMNMNMNNDNHGTANEIIHNLFTNIQRQHYIDLLLLEYESNIDECHPLTNIFLEFSLPRIITNLNNSFPIVKMFSRNILSIICLKDANNIGKLHSLFKSLNQLRDGKILFYLNRKQIPVKSKLQELQNLFGSCLSHHSLNVIALFKDFNQHKVFYSYTPFPNFTIEIKSLNNSIQTIYFPNRLANVFGHSLLTLPARELTRIKTLKTEANGYPVMIGYLANFIYLFANRINATLKFLYNINHNDSLFFGDLEDLATNGSIDVTTALVPVMNTLRLPYYSYPYEINKYCLMIPVAPRISLSHIIFYLVNVKMLAINIISVWIFTTLLNWRQYQLQQFVNDKRKKCSRPLHLSDFILNDVAVRGILGASFPMALNAEPLMKVIYMLLTLTGLYLNVMYNAYLQAMLTCTPRTRQPRTYDDVAQDGLHLLSSKDEWQYFSNLVKMPKNLLIDLTTLRNFNYERQSFNTTFAYPTSTAMWLSYFSQRQMIFSSRVFIFSEEACLPGIYLSSFALSDNSIYRSAINNLILQAQDYGLTNFWMRTSFFQLVKAKMLTYEDLSAESTPSTSLGMTNLKWLWIIYLVAMSVNSMIFLIELFISKRKIKGKST